MPSSKNIRTRKSIRGGLPLVILGLILLIAALASSFHPRLLSALFGGEETHQAVPAPPRPAETEDSARVLEAELREVYEREFDARLKDELERIRAADIESREPPSPAAIFDTPRGIVSDITNLSNGLPLKTELLYGTGGTALEEVMLHDSYTAAFQLKLRIPRPAARVSEIEKATPGIARILPGFPSLFKQGFVSPWHGTLYVNKLAEMRSHSKQLTKVPSKSDAYDCNTILHFRSGNGRRVFFMQADMDAVIKGSDGDRQAEMPASFIDSIHYDPFTSYHWSKRGDRENPMVAGWEKRIAIGRKELKDPSVTPGRKAWVEERIAMLGSGIEAMKRRGYLISARDPYIVLPLFLLKDAGDPFAPKVGDYAVVIHGGKVYPCLVGDKGSDSAAGEASARLAIELNPAWKSGTKAVPLPSVSYVVFPNSHETEPAPPDYAKWRKRCSELLREIGGLGDGVELHQWTDVPNQPAGKQAK